MRIGTFVMGGLAGAAIVMMLQRNNKMSAMTSGMTQNLTKGMNGMAQNLTKGMNGMTQNVIEKALNMNFNGGSGNSSDNSRNKNNNKSSPSRSHSDDDLSEVKKIASKDSSVAHEVNTILKENGQQQHQI